MAIPAFDEAQLPVQSNVEILIVEDDPQVRNTLCDILELKGFSVEAVDGGESAIEITSEREPWVALIDLKLADMSGLQLLRELKDQRPATECIILTGYASKESAIEAVNLGAYSYLQKPYDLDQLVLTIRRAFEKRAADALLSRRSSEQALLNDIGARISTVMRIVMSW